MRIRHCRARCVGQECPTPLPALNEEDGSGTLQATYIHHPGRQIGTVLATSEGSAASSGTWRYYFQDAIGSTRGVWDDVAVRAGKYEYTPFGGKYADHGDEISRKFTGHDWDADARLYYTAYRYYSPDSNRWLTRDPLGMVNGPNVYAYVVNNPVNLVDALGQCDDPPYKIPEIIKQVAILQAMALAKTIAFLQLIQYFKNTSAQNVAAQCTLCVIYGLELFIATYALGSEIKTFQSISFLLGVGLVAMCSAACFAIGGGLFRDILVGPHSLALLDIAPAVKTSGAAIAVGISKFILDALFD